MTLTVETMSIYGSVVGRSLGSYLLASRGKARAYTKGQPMALSLEIKALGQPLAVMPFAGSFRNTKSTVLHEVHDKLVPHKPQGKVYIEKDQEDLVFGMGHVDEGIDPPSYQRSFTPPPVAGSEGNNLLRENRHRHTCIWADALSAEARE